MALATLRATVRTTATLTVVAAAAVGALWAVGQYSDRDQVYLSADWATDQPNPDKARGNKAFIVWSEGGKTHPDVGAGGHWSRTVYGRGKVNTMSVQVTTWGDVKTTCSISGPYDPPVQHTGAGYANCSTTIHLPKWKP
jgi:hypothetical protein